MLKTEAASFGNLQNNCYIVTDEASNESALIDCTDDSAKMLNFIKGKNIKYIFLTHGHFDHIGGVKKVKSLTGAKVVISKEDEPMLSSSKASLAAFCGGVQNNTQSDIIVSDGDKFYLGDSVISAISTPGHTKGGMCYICEDMIFTGDTLFFCSCGRTDFPGGSSSEIIQSLKKIAALDGDLKVYPGHDRFSNLDFERTHNPYMQQ